MFSALIGLSFSCLSQNSITDFFDIIDSAEHTGQTHLIKSKNINIKLLQRYLKNYEKLALKAKPAKGNTDNTNKTKVYRTYNGKYINKFAEDAKKIEEQKKIKRQ